MFIFRDLSSGLWALLPWLNSSEACEHVFGEARQIVEDFTMLDFIYMIPKLRVKMRQAILQQKTSVSKVQASGYNHTYFDMAGLDELNLATFPSDADIEIAAQEASEEADSLIRLLGLRPQQINQFSLKNDHISPVFLPSIDSWFSDSSAKSNDESDNISITSTDDESISDAQELQNLLDREERMDISHLTKQERSLTNLTCAALALAADDMMKV